MVRINRPRCCSGKRPHRYPVLIKPVPGWRKGMRRVDAPGFRRALASCQREASASFADARVLVEKYLLQPRHIEIQVFTDHTRQRVYLFERDCSVQRRHQKVLEERRRPAWSQTARPDGRGGPGGGQGRRLRGCGHGGVHSEPGGQFFFMEMNTRLQVDTR